MPHAHKSLVTRRGAARWLTLAAIAAGASLVSAPRPAPTPWRHAFISASATAEKDGRRTRVRAVSRIFRVCESRDRPSAILDGSAQAFARALQARLGPGYAITFRYVEDHATPQRAASARAAALRDSRFELHLPVPYAWSTPAVSCDEMPPDGVTTDAQS